jgi:hypothetical protein
MKYTQVKNPIWANAEHTVINCEVDFDDLKEEFVPFSADLKDSYAHTKQIFNECVEGKWGSIAEFVPPPPYVPTAEDNKTIAVNLLTQTDWATIADVANPNISNPYLTNQQEFYDFRNIVRAIAINPVAGNLTWPQTPVATWSN